MDALQPIIPFLAWIVLAMVAGVGAMMVYFMKSFLDRVEKLFVTVGDHEGRLIVLETIEGIESKN
jgi:ABC-type bacteriocin/lantibiotic exporter with double-glycine peptidase domain